MSGSLDAPLRSAQEGLDALRRLAESRPQRPAEWTPALRALEDGMAQLREALRPMLPGDEPPPAIDSDPLQQLLDHTHVQIAYLDLDLNFIYVNAAYARGSGYTRDDLIGRNHFALFPHEENERIFRQVRDTGVTAEYLAKPFVYPDRPELGVTYWDWTLVPVKDSLGAVQGVLLSLVDVTEIKEAQREREHLLARLQQHTDELEALAAQRTAELRASEARFRGIFDEAPIGIVLCALDGRVVMSNPALERISGYPREELAGQRLTRLIGSEDDSECAHLWQELASESKVRCHLERPLVHRAGHTIISSWTACLMREQEGGPPFVLVMVEDITEQKQAEAALVQAEKLAIVGRLSASLTHELSNPLQSVMGCLGLAAEALAAGRSAERYLHVARGELRRAADIVSRMRDILRPSLAQDREPTEVQDLVEHVLTLVERKCADLRIGIVWRPAAELPAPIVVSDQIIQVILNIVLNAIESMPDGGLLRLTAEATAEPPGVTVTVADTGQGMSEEVLAHLFEPFYTSKREGVGLGLYVSRNIVEDHGGRIEVASQEGQGSTFSIWLPA